MLLAIDIGNSYTKFGIFESSTLIDKFSIPTARDYSTDELLFDRLKRNGERFLSIDTVAASSVVPELNETFRQALKKLLNVTPIFIDHTCDFGLKIDYDPPGSLGVDRLVIASAAAAKFGAPAIACSFGTATTFNAVDADSEFLGGAIAPGIRTMAESLHWKTSRLPLVEIEKPGSVLGRSTEDSIEAGVYTGHAGMVDRILSAIFDEMSARPKVVATGGFAKIVAAESRLIDVVDEDLTLDGIRMITERTAGT
ncbi:MAG: type III pantothenate kinase [Pyrinomonadaceae bacterium]